MGTSSKDYRTSSVQRKTRGRHGEEFLDYKSVENPQNLLNRQEILNKNEILKIFDSLSTLLCF